jgi:hypothetical protein
VFYRIPTRFEDLNMPIGLKRVYDNPLEEILISYGIHLLLAITIYYIILIFRIFYIFKVTKKLSNLTSQFLVFTTKNNTWKKTLSKELIYLFSTIPISLFFTCLGLLCIYFYSYDKIKKNEESIKQIIEYQDIAYRKYIAPIDFTENYFTWHSNDDNRIYSSIGVIYLIGIVDRKFPYYDLPRGIAYNMGYKDFYYKLYNKVIIEKDIQWTNNMQKSIRNIHTAFKDFKLKENLIDIDNFCIDDCEKNPLFAQKFGISYFIDKINNNINDDEWLNFFYNERAIKNPIFLSYMKSENINNKEDLRKYVNNNLKTDIYAKQNYENAKEDIRNIKYKFKDDYDIIYIGTDEIYEIFIPFINMVIMSILLSVLFVFRPLYIFSIWIMNNFRQ